MMHSLASGLTRFLKGARAFVRQGQDMILPPQCPLTSELVEVHGQLAPSAWQELDFIGPPFCRKCGIPFEVAASDALLCAACAAADDYDDALISRKALDQIRAALRYDDLSARLVLGLKYADRQDTAAGLATMMAQAGSELLQTDGILLTPVPLHSSRLRQRRFNQSALLAREIARQTGTTLVLDLVDRRRATPQQQGLSAKARKRNVKGAFRLNPQRKDEVEGKRIILVDDVLTTGSTLVECARVLKRGGAADVSALVLARVVNEGIIAI